MNARERTRLTDMLDAARVALGFVSGQTLEDFSRNRMLQLAVIKDLEIIGEAARHVSDDVRNELASVGWKDIIGMRNQPIHVYGRVDTDIVWSTVMNDLPVLVADLEKFLT